MRTNILLFLLAAIVMPGLFATALGQAIPAAGQQRSLPVAVGFGVSNFDLDWGWDKNGQRRMTGMTATLDAPLPGASGLLRGFGMEIEGRDINYLRPASYSNLRESTILGGSTYTWPYSRTFRPFAKYLWGIGAINFPRIGSRSHETRVVMAPGIGLQCRLFGGLWVRGDYEYQFWRQFLPHHDLTPSGFTISTMYDFKTGDRRRF